MDDWDPVTFLGGRLPSSFERRIVVVAPGETRAYDKTEWRDAIVVVERGRIELEFADGCRQDFGTGDVLSLVGLQFRVLRNRGRETAVLTAVSRLAS